MRLAFYGPCDLQPIHTVKQKFKFRIIFQFLTLYLIPPTTSHYILRPFRPHVGAKMILVGQSSQND